MTEHQTLRRLVHRTIGEGLHAMDVLAFDPPMPHTCDTCHLTVERHTAGFLDTLRAHARTCTGRASAPVGIPA